MQLVKRHQSITRPALAMATLVLALFAIAKLNLLKPAAPHADDLHPCAALYRTPTTQLSDIDLYRLRVCQAQNSLSRLDPPSQKPE
jgi:hypothetical protein